MIPEAPFLFFGAYEVLLLILLVRPMVAFLLVLASFEPS